jgi:hypothetical protein
MLSAGLAVAGLIIMVVSLPSWLLFSFLGAGLMAGAYVIYQKGL